MAPSVVQYTLDRLADLGIGHVFGVPGDYAFPINDAVELADRHICETRCDRAGLS
jgi:indolepyruvate decarboxylase